MTMPYFQARTMYRMHASLGESIFLLNLLCAHTFYMVEDADSNLNYEKN